MKTWAEAASVCRENGDRLREDAENLMGLGRFSTARALAILAQEEFAKAYLLRLVDDNVIPACAEVLRACRNHSCKHLIGLVMTHLFTPVEDWSSRLKRQPASDDTLPAHVADALNIFCHEKLQRWRSKNWFWVEEPLYDEQAKSIAEGSLDKVKQNDLYVGIGPNGVTSTPCCTEFEAQQALETTEKLRDVARGSDVYAFADKCVVTSGLKAMLQSL